MRILFTGPSHERENCLPHSLPSPRVRMQMRCLFKRRDFSRSTNLPLYIEGRGLEWNQSDMAFDGIALAIIKHLLVTRRGENIYAKISLPSLSLAVQPTIGSTRDTPIMIPQSLRNEKADSTAAAAPFVNGGILRGRRRGRAACSLGPGRSRGHPQWEFVDCRIRRGERSRALLSLYHTYG